MGSNYYLSIVVGGSMFFHLEISLHIGKLSGRRRFLFSSFEGRIKGSNQWRELTRIGSIVDSFGRVVEYDDFWKMVESYSGYPSEVGMYGKKVDVDGIGEFVDGEFS